MKILSICLLVFLSSFQTAIAESMPEPGDLIYSVQVAAVRGVNVADFESLSELGYVYTTAVTGKKEISRIQVGQFTAREDAETILAGVQSAGFPEAFIISKTLEEDNMLYLIQLAAYEYEDINWEMVEPAGNLYAQVAAKRLKVMTGPFTDITAVTARLNELRRMGYSDAFIKHINKDLVHRVGNFEKAINRNPITSKTIGEVKVKGQTRNFTPTEAPEDYNIEGFALATSRTSVTELQEALVDVESYNGNANGILNATTVNALNDYTATDERYAHYVERAKSARPISGTTKSALQAYIDVIIDDPTMAVNGLQSSEEPLAKAYTAYMIFTGKAALQSNNKKVVVNKLMNDAVYATFANNKYRGPMTLDANLSYDYEEVSTIIKHICYIQHASSSNATLPCWIFEEHSQEAVSILQELNIPLTTDCGDFMDWDEIKLLKEIASDLDPLPEYRKDEKALEELKAYRAKRAQLYLAPVKMGEMESDIIELWHQRLWESMDAHAATDNSYNNIIRTFKVSYFQAMVKLENHYIGRGFTTDESRCFAISTLRTVVNYHVGSYL